MDPIRGDLVHVDFLRTEATQRISAEVPVTFIGDSPRRLANGSVVQQLRSIVVEALPLDMPRELVVDLALLTEPDSIVRAGDLSLPEGTTLITNADGVVARIEVARVEEEVFGAEAPAAVKGTPRRGEGGRAASPRPGRVVCTWFTPASPATPVKAPAIRPSHSTSMGR